MSAIVVFAMMMEVAKGAAPTGAELDEARRWVAAKFEGIEEAPPARAFLEVLANHDAVQRNGRHDKPMKIADRDYTRGLYCHAASDIIVHLPGPGARFEAVAGVDTNEQTSGGRGSVVFSVRVGDREAWTSPLMREGAAGIPVSVDLGNASEFRLLVSAGGDGISCDQADWADARVALADGAEVWLADLPIESAERKPYTASPLFSFSYDGRPSAEFLSSWTFERDSQKLDDQRTQHTLRYTDPKTSLEARVVGVAYHDFPTVEWTLYFRNTGKKDTPILTDIQAVDTRFERSSSGDFVLYRNKGDDCTADSFEPLREPMAADTEQRIANTGGRPTQISFPFFNVQAGEGEGFIYALSWAGQWASYFNRDASIGLRVRGGQELTRFKLLPGEEVRQPMVVLQFWKGDRRHAQNVWRSWMIAHNMPRPGGKLPPVPQLAACSSHQYGEMINADSASQKLFVDKYLERGIKLHYWWMDAGWYWNKTGWPNTGTWEVDTNRFPGGLRPISDHAHAKGVNIIVWFEPERVTAGTWLTENHPDWILGGADGGLLNLGNPDAREWLINHVDGLINSEGIDLYRQDFNMDPLAYWRKNDTEDRQGITEIRHVEGYFAYWDELIRRHPNMLIDSCASGGRRNDLETLRRAVPLLRSDYIMEPIGNQCHTHTLSEWFPFYGTGTSKTDPYLIRSVLCPHFIACWDMRPDDFDYTILRREIDLWMDYGPNFMGDYYPLTSYSLANDQWIAWQFDRPEVGEGLVQAFRRDASVYESARFPLEGLDPAATYRVTNIDAPDRAIEMTGEELRAKGLLVEIGEKPGTAFFTYKRQ